MENKEPDKIPQSVLIAWGLLLPFVIVFICVMCYRNERERHELKKIEMTKTVSENKGELQW